MHRFMRQGPIHAVPPRKKARSGKGNRRRRTEGEMVNSIRHLKIRRRRSRGRIEMQTANLQ